MEERLNRALQMIERRSKLSVTKSSLKIETSQKLSKPASSQRKTKNRSRSKNRKKRENKNEE